MTAANEQWWAESQPTPELGSQHPPYVSGAWPGLVRVISGGDLENPGYPYLTRGYRADGQRGGLIGISADLTRCKILALGCGVTGDKLLLSGPASHDVLSGRLGADDGLEGVLIVEGPAKWLEADWRASIEGVRLAVIGVPRGHAPVLGDVRFPAGVPVLLDGSDRFAAVVASSVPRGVVVRRIPRRVA